MSNQILDDFKEDSAEITNQKHHLQARILFCIFISFLLLYILMATNFNNPTQYDIIQFAGQVLFFLFLLYYNIIHFKQERAFEKSTAQFPKLVTIFFLLGIEFMLLFSINRFILTITEDWFRLPTLILFSVILSILTICFKEIKYLRKV